MIPTGDRRPSPEESRFNHYRLPLLRALVRAMYSVEALTVLRIWNVRRLLDPFLASQQRSFRLLDLGCGLGDYLFQYAPAYPDAAFVGVDAFEPNVQVCRAVQSLRGLRNISFVQNDLSRYSPTDGIDVVLCITVLQYVDDLVGALKNAHNALHENGWLIVYQDVYDRRQSIANRARRASLEEQKTYTSSEVLNAVRNAGFTSETVQFCQGTVGGNAEAALKIVLDTVKKHPVTGIILLPLAAGLYPLYVLALWLDYRTVHTRGEGLLVVARPRRHDCREP